MKKPIRKLYRITPLNKRINEVQIMIWKNLNNIPYETPEWYKSSEITSYLNGLKDAKELVMGEPSI